MKINYIVLTLLFFLFSFQTFAQSIQQDTSDYPYWIEMMQNPDANFFATVSAFEKYWEGRTIQKGGGWKPFKRWEAYMESRVKPDGTKPAPDQVFIEILKKNSLNQGVAETSNANWTELGPVALPANGTGQPNGLGRVNAIGFHPNNGNTIFLGTPQGGLWKTTDNGNTWSSNTDALPTLGVSAVIINPDEPQTMYLGSGDRDGGDAPGLGVFKSYNGGTTWFQSNSGMGNRTVGKMLFSPIDTNIIFAASSGGIYKSTNGGASWTLKSVAENFRDIRFKPTSSSIMYATALGSFYRSTNAGESWILLDGSDGIPDANRMVIGVSEDDPNYVYVVATNSDTFKAMYLSTNSGVSFVTQSTTPNIMDYSTNGSGTSGQAWYDLCIAVDPLEKNTLYVGGVNIFKSTDAGVTWTINAHWVGSGGVDEIHADQHVLEYSPVNGNLYNGNDGGFYFTSNGGTDWTDKSSGLAIAQIYKIGQSATVRDLVINGYQDNGTAIYDGAWRTEIGGDGMECLIDYTNSNYIYGSLYYGDIRRSTNNGNSFSQIAGDGVNGIDEEGPWVTPYTLHETDPNTMFVGMRNIWRSTNVKSGTPSFTKITNLSTTNTTRVIEHSPANNSILYFARTDQFFNRMDLAASPISVTNLTANLPNNSRPTDIEAHPTDENIVYITQSNKVYKSSDKGVTWTNITGSVIPNVSINCIVYAENTSNGLYVGTDAGVYYREDGYSDWEDFTNGLPLNSAVTELEIYYDNVNLSQSVIRGATYGRGLWESPLQTIGAGPTVANFSANTTLACINATVIFTDESSWSPTSHSWTFTPNTVTYVNGTTSSSPNPEVEFNALGNYTVELTASNTLGGSTETKTNYIQVTGGIAPPSEDFQSGTFPPVNWTIVNNDGGMTWEESSSVTGSDGNTTLAATINNYAYNSSGQEDEFNSVLVDLTNVGSASLSFDLAYVPYSSTYNDSMRVDVFTNCGAQLGATIFGESYLNLATAPTSTSSFVPSSASDWENKTFDLSAYVGDVIVIKFINVTGYGNNLYIDNINISSSVTFVNYYPDMDGDGYGDMTASAVQVQNGNNPPTDHVVDNTDCDDNNLNIYPGNTELCDGINNNCDNEIDEGFPDTDGDNVADCIDNCIDISNPNQENADGDNYGDDCDCNPNDPNDENLNISDDPIASGNYIYNNTITADGYVHDVSTVVFKAGNFIDMKVGFIAEVGSDFTAQIDDCTANPPQPSMPQLEDTEATEEQLELSAENVAVKIFPNPFKEKTNIIVIVKNPQHLDLAIYNSTGNSTKKILDQKFLKEGTYQFEVDGSNWGLGMYHAILRTEKETKAVKMMIIR